MPYSTAKITAAMCTLPHHSPGTRDKPSEGLKVVFSSLHLFVCHQCPSTSRKMALLHSSREQSAAQVSPEASWKLLWALQGQRPRGNGAQNPKKQHVLLYFTCARRRLPLCKWRTGLTWPTKAHNTQTPEADSPTSSRFVYLLEEMQLVVVQWGAFLRPGNKSLHEQARNLLSALLFCNP